MNLKEAMKKAKATGKPQRVTEPLKEPIETKVVVSIRLDLEVLNWLKAEADKQGLPYTTLANSLLKRASEMEDLETRLQRLEKALLSKKNVG